jgi:asparagine synthase (glutamine-hydrolysing)
MHASFLGGIWKRGPANKRRTGAPTPDAVNEDWGWVGEATELFVRSAAACTRIFTWDGLALLLRGYARPAGMFGPLDLERVAEELRCHYLEHGTLAVDDLEGSFTLALLDSQAERVILYRNLIGSGFTYYRGSADGLLFGGNLAELVDLSAQAPTANHDVLPSFFLFRCVPGRETLFRDFYRLLPGEQLSWDRRGLTRVQRHTFASLCGDFVPADAALDRVEEVMSAVLLDCAALYPEAANLLSGGVDSSYIQVIWNRISTSGESATPPASYSVSVDHPHTWMDTDYAMTATQALGTRHTLVPADGPYMQYLVDALASTGEPLNHVQSAYFGHLARAMHADGVKAGLCGEGADSLFGLGLANKIHNARLLRRLLPAAVLRSLAGVVVGVLGHSLLADTCRLANHIDDFNDLHHPINRIAAFADWRAVEECFGAAAIDRAARERRRLLDLYCVNYEAQDRLHAAGFLGEAMDSAGLWVTLFNRAGLDLHCPFLDSRMLRLALNLPPQLRYPFRRPKDLLKRALARRAPAELATRCKLGFGQPIFEWLGEGGQLRDAVERLERHDFVEPATLARLKKQPTWFLYSLLCYDTWHRIFIGGRRGICSPSGVALTVTDAPAPLSVPPAQGVALGSSPSPIRGRAVDEALLEPRRGVGR